jgi:hypothetical protein
MRPILIIHNDSRSSEIVASLIANQMQFAMREITTDVLNNIGSIIEEEDAALLIIGLNNDREIQPYLNKCRELRVPYIFVKNDLPRDYNIETILLPVTNLEEEREKGPYTSSLSRHFNSHIKFYQPNDYGTKAATNIEAMKVLFNSFDLTYTTTQGKKDSSNIELETAKSHINTPNSILIISASRDYGLDDLIFGPKERKILKTTNIPTMLINPRGDLYALCD